ncbi:hypothetical protein PV04_09456 [Phialophora macrospora]|uniref:Uncharacterized protein n=1 Tax=Phialophora macrospora TaxID=1851006 RepID=A0A0D2FX92_9EURO|nr:hypothetical protein PV04_09456 [Phialophora macrospora]
MYFFQARLKLQIPGIDIENETGEHAALPEVDHLRQSDKDHHKDGTMEVAAASSVSKSLKRKLPGSKLDDREPSSQKSVKVDRDAPCLAPEAANPETTVEAPASLATIEPEVRLEILRQLLFLERNQVVTYRSAHLDDLEFKLLGRDPDINRDKFTPGQWQGASIDDHVLHRSPARNPLPAPGPNPPREDILHSGNHSIGIHGAPDDLVNTLRKFGVGPRRWTGTGGRLLPQPVLQIDFRPEQLDFRPDRWLLFPPSDLRRLSLALYPTNVFNPSNMTYLQRMHLRIFPGIRLLKAFGQKEITGIKDLLRNDVIDWIGSEVTGCLADGMRTPSCRDCSMGKASPLMLDANRSAEKI